MAVTGNLTKTQAPQAGGFNVVDITGDPIHDMDHVNGNDIDKVIRRAPKACFRSAGLHYVRDVYRTVW